MTPGDTEGAGKSFVYEPEGWEDDWDDEPEDQQEQTKPNRAIIRRANGAVDDVVIDGDVFRMEQMDRDSWWVCIYRGDKRVSFSLTWDKKRREIVAFVTDDSIGCVDDS